MKILLRRNITNLGTIGEVVDVKPGYARNFLIPQGLATAPTKENVEAVEAEKEQYLAELAKIRAEMEVKAKALEGRELTIPARANNEGHLYGSIGPAQIVAALAEENVFLEAKQVLMAEVIREVGEHQVTIRFADDIETELKVTVLPMGEDGKPLPLPTKAPVDLVDVEDASLEDADDEYSEDDSDAPADEEASAEDQAE